LAFRWVKESGGATDGNVTDGTCGGRGHDDERMTPMSVFLSWARSTVANLDRALGRTDQWFDRILVGVLVLLVIAVAFLFSQ
jgi:hypothetical protein